MFLLKDWFALAIGTFSFAFGALVVGALDMRILPKMGRAEMFRFFIKVVILLLDGIIDASCTVENRLYDCVFHIISERFPKDCVCFFVDATNHSLTFENLMKNVGELSPVYVVSPEPDDRPGTITKTRPVKPFPCYFIIDLPYVGSNMTRSFLAGSYQSGDYNLTESRYLIVAEEHHTHQQAADVLREMFGYGFLDVDIVVPEESQIAVLTYFPFGRKFEACPETSQPIVEYVALWSHGKFHEEMPLFPKKMPSGSFAGCSWNISCAFIPPYAIVNSGGRFSGPLPGYDAGVISLLMKRLNLTPEWFIDSKYMWFHDHGNGSYSGAIPALEQGEGAQMGCGGLYQTSWALGNLEATHFHTWAKLVWFAAAPNKVPKWIMIFEALNKDIWATVIVTSVIVPVIYWVFCILTKRQSTFGQVFLMLTALMFSNSSGTAPANITLRIIFFVWLFYALHIDQFYLASLTGLITSAEYEPTMKTAGDLLDSGLPTAVYVYTFKTLNSSDNPKIVKLLKRHVLMTERVDHELIRMSSYKNFTIADNFVFVKYRLSSMPNVSIYPTQVTFEERTMSTLMWRHNYLFPRINWILTRMFDAGWPVYYLKRTVPNRFWTDPMDNTARPFNLRDLSGPFNILIIGHLLSFVAFLTELLYFNRSRIFRQYKNE